jgi:hypothetical protein
MKMFLRTTAAVCFAALAMASAQGGSAIITLVMPPPGGDGFAALQSGAALSQGAASLYYNPALLADLERSAGSQLFYTHSDQDLLPSLKFPDLYQKFQAGALVAPDPEAGTDMAFGLFRNEVNFGHDTYRDADGNIEWQGNSYETVYGAGVAVRLGIPISVGATAKFYESHLADDLNGAEPGVGWAFDIGVLANPRFEPSAGAGFPAIAITPSFALVVKNLGPDVFYREAWQADPIPTTYTRALGIKAEAFDALEFECGSDLDQYVGRNAGDADLSVSTGFSGLFLVYRYGTGWLTDVPGRRLENHVSHAMEFNLLRLHRLYRRLVLADFTSPSRTMDAGFLYAKTRILGVPFRANPRFTLGWREIESFDGGIRNGQDAIFLGLSL